MTGMMQKKRKYTVQKLTGSDMSSGYQGTTGCYGSSCSGCKGAGDRCSVYGFGPGTIASGLGASAFGVGASAQDKSVAIGAGSTTTINAEKITTATVNGITYGGFAGTNNLDAWVTGFFWYGRLRTPA